MARKPRKIEIAQLTDVSIDDFLIGGFFDVNTVLEPLLILAII